MIDKKILTHPTIQQHADLQGLCRPLYKIGADYFCQVRITDDGGFFALSNNPKYHEHYLNHRYYNCDIHMADHNTLGNLIVWDFVKRSGNSEQMVRDAAAFGVSRLLTIVRDGEGFTDYFHVGSSHADESINQAYITHFDQLEHFINHYMHTVQSDKALSAAWDIAFYADDNQAQFEVPAFSGATQTLATESSKLIPVYFKKRFFCLSVREKEVLSWLSLGKTAEETGRILEISASTARKHIENIKAKSGCYTLFQLGELYAAMVY